MYLEATKIRKNKNYISTCGRKEKCMMITGNMICVHTVIQYRWIIMKLLNHEGNSLSSVLSFSRSLSFTSTSYNILNIYRQ